MPTPGTGIITPVALQEVRLQAPSRSGHLCTGFIAMPVTQKGGIKQRSMRGAAENRKE